MDAEELVDDDPVSGLFSHLASGRVFGVFAGFEPSAGERPRGSASLDPVSEQEAVVGVRDDGVRGDSHIHCDTIAEEVTDRSSRRHHDVDMASSTASEVDLSRRDLTLDLARVTAVLIVVVVHLLQVGVAIGPGGGIVTSRPAEEQPWFDVATWFGQIMPLFFVVGGFASAAGWASWTAKGGDATGFIRTRTLRLAQPALPFFLVIAALLGAATAIGIAPEVVDAAAIGVGMPLWFLAAYLLCQLLVPIMTRCHATAPRRSVVLMLAGVLIVDAIRYATGVEQIGLVNLLFVWPLIQQIGFWYHDGWFDRRGRVMLTAIAVAGFAVFLALMAWGPYSTNLLADLNPPTLPLVVLGVTQAALLRLARPALAALMRTRAMRGVVFVLGSRLMTIYLWHLPVILLLSGIALLIPGAAPQPASPVWWWTRPVLFVVVLGVLGVLSLGLARFESLGRLGPSPSRVLVGIAWCGAFLPPFLIMEWGMNLTFAVTGAILTGLAVLLLRTRPVS